MQFLIRNRVRECKPIPLFEELEQRIVLDASVDSDTSGHALDASHASQGWNLEYASDPSVSLAPVINAGELTDYRGSLSVITWAAGFRPDTQPQNSVVVPGGAGSNDTVSVYHQIGGLFYLDTADTTPDTLPMVTLSVPGGGGWSKLNVDTAISGTTVTGSGTSSVSIQGTPAAINAVLSTLNGQFPAGYNTGNDWNGIAYVPQHTTIFCSAFDTDDVTANPADSAAFTAYFVDGANGMPNITAPITATVNQDIPFNFSGGNLISVTDPDWEDSDMEVLYCKVTVDNGTINLKDTSSLNRYSHDANYQTWEIEAYLPWINQALAALEYTGTKAGADTLSVTVNDWGNHGGLGTLNVPPPGDGTALITGPADQTNTPDQTGREATATVNINVLMTNIDNTPQIDMDPTAVYNTGAAHAIVWPDATHILDANDADQLDVSLRVHHGTLGFGVALPAGVTTVLDSQGPPGDSLVYLQGPQTLLNYSLSNLRYTPYPYATAAPYDYFKGSDILTVTVMDNDTTHLGSRDPVQRTQEQRMVITVT